MTQSVNEFYRDVSSIRKPNLRNPHSTPRLVDRHIVAIRVADHEHTHQRTVVGMWRLFNHAIQCLCALPGWIEIVHHKPQEKPVPYVALLRISE
jgi:hypothetical protein